MGFVGSAFLVMLIIILGVDYFWQEDESTSEPIRNNGNNDVDNTGERSGFEPVFAIAGLLAVAYLALRQRE